MLIKSVRVQNFRSIKEATLECEPLTILVGPNGAGKSSFLNALELFYSSSARYTEDDFYNVDTSQPIRVTVTFTKLEKNEEQLFAPYIKTGLLSVEKELGWPTGRGSQKYYGRKLRNPEFIEVRNASGAMEMRSQYRDLRQKEEYEDLPNATTKEDIGRALNEWESANLDECEWAKDDGQFFGFKEVGEARLERFTRFVHVPAVREAAEDATEGRGSPITELLDIVVRTTLAQNEAIVKLQEDTQHRYTNIVNNASQTILKDLESKLSRTLRTYVSDSGLEITWDTKQVVQIPAPKANIKLIEDDFPTTVERTGHGVQRAFILTLLQHLALERTKLEKAERDESTNGEGHASLFTPSLIFEIEEPELYQHPNRQRHFARVLQKLTEGSISGVTGQTQVIYSTHSPLFVDIDRFNQVRRLSKITVDNGKPRQTQVYTTSLDIVAQELETADGKSKGTFTGETLRPRLSSIMNPQVNEGFFADIVVLVEGEEDKAAVLCTAEDLGYNFEDAGISVIPCGGKANLDRPTIIFRQLGIPVYAVWDSDKGDSNPQTSTNHRLLRLFGATVEDYPAKVESKFACFGGKLEETLREELGEDCFKETQRTYQEKYGHKKSKNPFLLGTVLKELCGQGRKSATLEKIICNISHLAGLDEGRDENEERVDEAAS